MYSTCNYTLFELFNPTPSLPVGVLVNRYTSDLVNTVVFNIAKYIYRPSYASKPVCVSKLCHTYVGNARFLKALKHFTFYFTSFFVSLLKSCKKLELSESMT